jgi:hypothetical protein
MTFAIGISLIKNRASHSLSRNTETFFVPAGLSASERRTTSKVRIARDPGGTGGRGIADRFCYADLPVTYLRVAQIGC